MKRPLVIQRLRSWTAELHQEPTHPGWNRSDWQRKGLQTYWETSDATIVVTASTLSIRAGQSLSSDTFFNGFFLAHWRRVTTLQNLSLHLTLEGVFRLDIFLHSALEGKKLLQTHAIRGDGEPCFKTSFDLSRLPSGLRLSFELTALHDSSGRFEGHWETEDVPAQEFSLAIGIATYNRQEFASRMVTKLLSDPGLMQESFFIRVIDQSDFSKLEHLNGPRCQVIRQKNLGGAGGFSRSIYEAVYAPDVVRPSHVLLMDDDSELESDSLLRMIRFTQFARKPTVLGGTMLDLYLPQLTQTLGERYKKDVFDEYDQFYNIYSHLHAADVTAPNTKNVISLPVEADYAAWWFCLIPTEAILKVGLPFPCFVSLDDVEYGSRIHRLGYAVHTLPGIGLWHVPFYTKVAPFNRYFETYNKTILNALFERECFEDRFHFFSIATMNTINIHFYQHALAMIWGLEDVVAGWSRLKERAFPDHLVRLRKELASFDLNDKGARPNEAQSVALKERLGRVMRQFEKKSSLLYSEFRTGIPLSFTVESWCPYFESGDLSHLPKVRSSL